MDSKSDYNQTVQESRSDNLSTKLKNDEDFLPAPSSMVIPAKKIIWDQAIATTIIIGVNTFVISLFDTHNFATSCLQFSGFLTVAVIYRCLEIKNLSERSPQSIVNLFIGNFYDRHSGKFNSNNIYHLGLRAATFFAYTMVLMASAAYALKAQINYGIIATCVGIQVPLKCIIGVLVWNEKLKPQIVVGTIVVLGGVTWIAFEKGAFDPSMTPEELEAESDRVFYKWVSIMMALLGGVLNTLRTVQAKYVHQHYKYAPAEFAIDAGFFLGIALFAFAAYFYISGTDAYNGRNLLVAWLTSGFQMTISILGLNCTVKGLAGPTSAIFQANIIVGVLLSAIFLSLVPTVEQVLASIAAIFGIILMILSK